MKLQIKYKDNYKKITFQLIQLFSMMMFRFAVGKNSFRSSDSILYLFLYFNSVIMQIANSYFHY